MKRQRKGERGASSVEVAVILPVLLLATVGIIDFARIVSARNMLSNAAREATRYASVRSIESDDPVTSELVLDQVLQRIGPLDPELLTIHTTWSPQNAPGATVEVDLLYDFQPISPLMPFELLQLNAASQLMISY